MVISKNSRKPLIVFCVCIMIISSVFCLFYEDSIFQGLKVLTSSIFAVCLSILGFNRNNEIYYASNEGFKYKGTTIHWGSIIKLRYKYNYYGQHRHECHLYVDDGRVIEFCWDKKVISYLEQYIEDVDKFRKGV